MAALWASLPHQVRHFSVAAAAVGGVVLFKEVLAVGNYTGAESLEGKTVVVTGANSGIGKETARGFAKRKARVIMACRDLEKCKTARRELALDTRNTAIACRQCDLSDFHSVREFAALVKHKEERLDILVNNAAVMRLPGRTLTPAGIEAQLATNHLGHFLLTQLLLDKLKASPAGRIVTVASVAHRRGELDFADLNQEEYDPAKAYNASKLANVLHANKLARELEDTNITVASVHPGNTNTNLFRHMAFAKNWFAMGFLWPVLWLFLKTPRQGAQTTLYAALSEDVESGGYYVNQSRGEQSEDAGDHKLQDRLWATSMLWCGLS